MKSNDFPFTMFARGGKINKFSRFGVHIGATKKSAWGQFVLVAKTDGRKANTAKYQNAIEVKRSVPSKEA